MEVERTSPEYKTVEDHFKKKWSNKEKKVAPSLTQVLAVLNPSLEAKFTTYNQLQAAVAGESTKEKKNPKLVKKLFYGTELGCDLYTYQVPCRHGYCRVCSKIPSGTRGRETATWEESGTGSSSCGVCEVVLHGFSRLSMSGVVLDKNPGHSHDKAKLHLDSLTYALVMCDVAWLNPKKFKRERSMSESEVQVHPEGFDAVQIHSRSKSFLKHSTDEVKVYKGDAICPRYVLLYV